MPSRIATAVLVIGLLAFGSVGAFAAVGHVDSARSHHAKAGKKHHAKAVRHAKRKHHKARHTAVTKAPAASTAAPAAAQAAPAAAQAADRSAAAQEYGTRPGKGCGDKNHEHTGPPGNPSNTDCPPHP